jgi:hypothetical protein
MKSCHTTLTCAVITAAWLGCTVSPLRADGPSSRPIGPTPVLPQDSILSEDVPGAPPNPDPPPYTLLRFNEDYRYLSDPRNRTDLFDPLKYIPLNSKDPDSYLSLGGEIRERYENFSQPGFGTGKSPSENEYLLQRITLDADLHLNDHIRFFTQAISGLQFGQTGPSSAVNQNPVDLQQAFVDVVVGDPDGKDPRLTTRLGRFQMTFGSGRLIATRAAPNVPFKFDGVELIGAVGKSRLYGFIVRPSEEEKYRFDGENDAQTFWGAYGTTALGGPLNTSADLYYLGFRDRNASFIAGNGTEMRHTIGTRLFGKVNGWDYDVEPVGQFGTFNGQQIHAWTAATDFGYTFEGLDWKPRLGSKFDVASGDTRGKGFDEFNPLFFKSGYFNDASLIRPSNIIDVHPTVQFRPFKGMVATLGSDVLWRETTNDGVYAPPGFVELPAGDGSNYIGTTAEAAFQYQINRHLVWTTSYVHLFSGDYVHSSGGRDVDYIGSWLSFTF